MRSLLTITALIELGVGFALVCFPTAAVKLFVGELIEAPAALTVARIGGAGILALGIACWIARGDRRNHAAIGLIVAMSVYNLAAVAILGFAGVGLGLHGALLWPGVLLHATMSVWCIVCLSRRNDGPDSRFRG